MAEPSVQVPAVLAQQMRGYFRARIDAFSRQKAEQLDALLSQPTPTAEPPATYQQGYDDGFMAGEHHVRNAETLPATPPRIPDMVPGSEHPRAQSIGVVARSIVHSLLTEADSDDIALWEDYPEIGENDWDEVIAAARSLAPAPPSDEEYRAAYAALDLSTIRDVQPPEET